MSTDRQTRVEGGFEITDTLVDGVLMGTAITPIPTAQEQAEDAAVQARRDVLQAVVDPKRATPPAEDVLQAQAFLALAELDGVKAALGIAGELDAAVPVDPKGIVGGLATPDS